MKDMVSIRKTRPLASAEAHGTEVGLGAGSLGTASDFLSDDVFRGGNGSVYQQCARGISGCDERSFPPGPAEGCLALRVSRNLLVSEGQAEVCVHVFDRGAAG